MKTSYTLHLKYFIQHSEKKLEMVVPEFFTFQDKEEAIKAFLKISEDLKDTDVYDVQLLENRNADFFILDSRTNIN